MSLQRLVSSDRILPRNLVNSALGKQFIDESVTTRLGR
jgi:hypothetical protein